MKKKISLILLVIIGLCFAWAVVKGFRNFQYNGYMSQALDYYTAFDNEKALKSLDKAIRVYPFRGEAYNEKAAIYLFDKNYEQALVEATNLVDVAPSKKAYITRAEINICLGNKEAAAEDIQIAEAFKKEKLDSYWGLAFLYCALEEHEKALTKTQEWLKDVLAQKAGGQITFSPLYYSAVFNYKLGRYEEALKIIDQARKDIPDPDSIFIHALDHISAKIYLAKKDFKKAAQFADSSINVAEKKIKLVPSLRLVNSFDFCDCDVYLYSIPETYKTRADIKTALNDKKGATADMQKYKELDKKAKEQAKLD
ncbi:hypothetical protein Emin_1102 [Elusimicrobium minutum Pei191]|uniref:Tetratricopeptide repeat protein n=1 Tax=Elusimicrobium minutum (strain Pei191) TaxID=445932 RepID=B2KDQ8_ELUMP|nr:tetratricopeptide repeat protein [Elusimicrobium minutum]ACC98654.1 hypothetical protein Emin_1102 [Elusimicrobium minutum Pei191]